MDEIAARRAFERAIVGHQLTFEKFFLSRFLDLRFSYRNDCCYAEFALE